MNSESLTLPYPDLQQHEKQLIEIQNFFPHPQIPNAQPSTTTLFHNLDETHDLLENQGYNQQWESNNLWGT